MNSRKIIVLIALATALLLSLAPGFSVQAEEVEAVWEYDGDYDNEIKVDVAATTKAYPGDIITVAIEGEAKDDLEDVDLDIWVEGSSGEGAERWESAGEEVLDRDDLDDGDDFDEEYEFEIPETADSGAMLGHVICELDVWDEGLDDWVTHSFDTAFPITFLLGAIPEEEYEELQDDYAELQTVYTQAVSERDNWRREYTSLESEHNSLSAEYNNIKSSYDGLTSSYDSLKSSYDSQTSSYNSLKSEHDTLLEDYDAQQDEYISLDSEHKSLLSDYSTLESEYGATAGERDNYQTYTYFLAVATVIFLATTIIFAVKKPKTE